MNAWKRLFTIISSYVLLGSSIITIIISGTSYAKFCDQKMFKRSPDVNFEFLFGIGIGISLLSFILIWIYLAFPRLKFHCFVTFPLVFLLPVTYIYFSRHGYAEEYLKNWNSIWEQNDIEVENLQMQYKCCGWMNVTDRSLSPCPFDFENGCYKTILDYLQGIAKWNFVASLSVIILSLASSIVLFISIGRNPESSVLALLQVA